MIDDASVSIGPAADFAAEGSAVWDHSVSTPRYRGQDFEDPNWAMWMSAPDFGRATLAQYQQLNLSFPKAWIGIWRVRPTEATDVSRWPRDFLNERPSVRHAFVIPGWSPEREEAVCPSGEPWEAYLNANAGSSVPAQLWTPDGSLGMPAVLLPGEQSVVAEELRSQFGADVIFEWTPNAWIINSRRHGVVQMGWKRSSLRWEDTR